MIEKLVLQDPLSSPCKVNTEQWKIEKTKCFLASIQQACTYWFPFDTSCWGHTFLKILHINFRFDFLKIAFFALLFHAPPSSFFFRHLVLFSLFQRHGLHISLHLIGNFVSVPIGFGSDAFIFSFLLLANKQHTK